MQQIVVGFVDVPTARQVGQEAVALASQLGTKLHVVTAIDDDTSTVLVVGGDQWEVSEVSAAESVIHEFMRSLPNEVDYTVAVLEGKPSDVLITEAERLDADLIVVGNVRMHGPGRLLGSVGSGVAHHAPCSVYIVKTT